MKPRTYNSQILKTPRALNILQRPLQILQLLLHNPLRLLRTLHSRRLERLNGLDLPSNIDLLDSKVLEGLFHLVDDALVLEQGAVVLEVDFGGELTEGL